MKTATRGDHASVSIWSVSPRLRCSSGEFSDCRISTRLGPKSVTLRSTSERRFEFAENSRPSPEKAISRWDAKRIDEKHTQVPLVGEIEEECIEIMACRFNEFHPGGDVAGFGVEVKVQRAESLGAGREPTEERTSSGRETPPRCIFDIYQQGRWDFWPFVRLLFFIGVFMTGLGNVEVASSEMGELWEGRNKVYEVWEILEGKILDSKATEGWEGGCE